MVSLKWRGVECSLLAGALVVAALAHGVLGKSKPKLKPWTLARLTDFPFIGILDSPRKTWDPTLGALITPRALIGVSDNHEECKNPNVHVEELYYVCAGINYTTEEKNYCVQDRKVKLLTMMQLDKMDIIDKREHLFCRFVAVTYEPFDLSNRIKTIPVLQHVRLWPKHHKEKCKAITLLEDESGELFENEEYIETIQWIYIHPLPVKNCEGPKVEGFDLCVNKTEVYDMCRTDKYFVVVVCQNALSAFFGSYFHYPECDPHAAKYRIDDQRLMSTFDDLKEWIYSSSCPESLSPADFPMPKGAGRTLSTAPAFVALSVLVASCTGCEYYTL